MAPLVPEGGNLGETHHKYNQIVEKVLADGVQPEKLDPNNSDLDNLLKIDIASKQKNVDYILEVLKSEDMLYVSRAIKQSTWLITDPQYSHIVNPEYLHKTLFPLMTAKAISKFMFNIRLLLNSEDRVDQFYRYLQTQNSTEKDKQSALKWLPKGSLSLIEEEIKKNANENCLISIIKRLCERSPTFLNIAIDNSDYNKREILVNLKFLLKTDTDRYLNVLFSVPRHEWPRFGPNLTAFLMKHRSQIVMDKFEKFADIIDLPTFAKHLKKDEIKDFLVRHMASKELKYWFSYYNIKELVKHMPKEGRFEFLKELFIDKPFKDPSVPIPYGIARCSLECSVFNEDGNSNICRWYRFASFEVAFQDLRKLIRSESLSTERNSILSVLLFCAKGNPKHIHELLQFYHDKHINEPFKFKVQFINEVISKTETYKYNEATWKILENIFRSMEVYIESDNNIQSCIESIIVYQVLHGKEVPEIIEKKFCFNTMKNLKNKLNENERKMIFDYLYKMQMTKLQSKKTSNEKDFIEAVCLLESIMCLVSDWNHNPQEFPEILTKVKEFIKIKQEHKWDVSLSPLYTKQWRKVLFEESLLLFASEDSLINAIKHDSKLLARYKSEITPLRFNDSVSLKRLLRKLKVYFQSLAAEWTPDYVEHLDKPGGHKALTQALCTLLPSKTLRDILNKYAPTDTKINWTEDDELVLSLRKNLGKSMHLGRPLVPPEIVMSYARGDYLQFALPSLLAVFYNLSSFRCRELIPKLLKAPVSVQKHGIKVAFNKLRPEEMKQVLSDLWKSNKNATIRGVIFKLTYDLMCKEKNTVLLQEFWHMLSTFIDDLSSEEDKNIYKILSKVEDVPLVVRGKYCMKSYTFLKSLPAKANCERLVLNIKTHMISIMEHLELDFITEVVQTSLKDFTSEDKYFGDGDLIWSYLLCVKDEESQKQRYEKVLLPLLDKYLPERDLNSRGFQNTNKLLKQMSRDVQQMVFEKKMVFPIKMFTCIAEKMQEHLDDKFAYVLLRTWKLHATLFKLLDEHKDVLNTIETKEEKEKPHYYYYDPQDNPKWDPFYLKVTKQFGDVCIEYLKEDITKYFPTINVLFSEALCEAFAFINQPIYLEVLKNVLENCAECASCYVMVLYASPSSTQQKNKEKIKEIYDKIATHPSVEVSMHYHVHTSKQDPYY